MKKLNQMYPPVPPSLEERFQAAVNDAIAYLRDDSTDHGYYGDLEFTLSLRQGISREVAASAISKARKQLNSK
ncbi:MAG TPA: hypothetical protein VGP35_13400 [Terriglobales bacterium]|jgi:hypothetical protein|nr:hypothetical protein [Terriglobales bacterium]